jgi:Polyketide cyclase / dehydrase and lipid transport
MGSMAQAYASTIINAPVEAVWAEIRDFGALAAWHPGIAGSEIENGDDPDVVGCIRALRFKDGGGGARERLLMLDDSRYTFSYNFETPAFPIEHYVATVELIPVTNGDLTFAQWHGTFDERPEDAGTYVDIISNGVFATGWAALAAQLDGAAAPEGAVRWQGFRPAKVFCSSRLRAPVSRVWQEMRDFASMGGWHPDIAEMHMLDGARPDKISGVRDFRIGTGRLQEQLTAMSDPDHSFRYTINASTMPWLNYHSGVRLYPVTASGECFAVWTADWVASANDDLRLIPMVHDDVFQRAFDTLDAKLKGAA